MPLERAAPDPSGAWDPDPLTVGTRVRVRFRGEMPLAAALPQRLDGAVATVVDVYEATSDDPVIYPYLVTLDSTNTDLLVARIELERLP